MEQTVFHPGDHLQLELDELSMTPAQMAEKLGVSEKRLADLLRGATSMDAELAMRLGHYFGMPAKFWLNLQTHYDLSVADRAYGSEIAELPTLQHQRAA